MSSRNTFDTLYSEYYMDMYRIAKKLTDDEEGAADIIQEVFIHLFNSLNNGIDISHPKGWLYRVTYLKCMDHFRKIKRSNVVELTENIEYRDEQNEKQELKVMISHAMSKLKPQERVLAVLYSEGLTYNEMASATGIKFSSIGKTLSRSLKKLGKELNNQRYEMY